MFSSAWYLHPSPSKKLYGKRNDFTFPVVNFPFICGNIFVAPANGVHISQLIRYSRACDVYHDFLSRAHLLTNKLLTQGFVAARLRSSLMKFYGRHQELVDSYETVVAKMQSDLFSSSNHVFKGLWKPFCVFFFYFCVVRVCPYLFSTFSAHGFCFWLLLGTLVTVILLYGEIVMLSWMLQTKKSGHFQDVAIRKQNFKLLGFKWYLVSTEFSSGYFQDGRHFSSKGFKRNLVSIRDMLCWFKK